MAKKGKHRLKQIKKCDNCGFELVAVVDCPNCESIELNHVKNEWLGGKKMLKKYTTNDDDDDFNDDYEEEDEDY